MRTSLPVAAGLAALSTILGCGSTTSPTTLPGVSSSCTVTLSGALTGTYDCEPATTAWSSSNNTGGFGFSVQSPSVTLAIGWPGEPQTGSYASGGAGVTGGVSVTSGSGASTQVWGATTGNSATGSFTLTFTSIGGTVAVSSGKAYRADGSLTATLSPLTGQQGAVTVTATF